MSMDATIGRMLREMPPEARRQFDEMVAATPALTEEGRRYMLLTSMLKGLDPTTAEYREFAACVLNRLNPTAPAGTVLCNAIMCLWPTIAFEGLMFRVGRERQVEVFLRQRALDDTAYPGQWHAPGSLYRAGERDADVANRLAREFGCTFEYTYVDRHITTEARGTIMSLLFLCRARGEVRVDERHRWFPVDALPEGTVDFHRDVYIPQAALEFERRMDIGRNDPPGHGC